MLIIGLLLANIVGVGVGYWARGVIERWEESLRTPSMRTYLALERAVDRLVYARDPIADTLRERMDRIWLEFSAREREELDSRPALDDRQEVRTPVR